MWPKVITPYETVLLLKEGRSIYRFGDGEFRVMLGGKTPQQEPNEEAQKLLKIIVNEPNSSIPPNGWFQQSETQIWESFLLKEVYYNTFMTRPDIMPEIRSPVYWKLLESLWLNEPSLLVANDSILKRGMFKQTLEISKINAFSDYKTTFNKIKQHPKDTVIVLCGGVTGTVLAWMLEQEGFQALDLGHVLDFFYRTHPKAWKVMWE